jgi:hypothetical protein
VESGPKIIIIGGGRRREGRERGRGGGRRRGREGRGGGRRGKTRRKIMIVKGNSMAERKPVRRGRKKGEGIGGGIRLSILYTYKSSIMKPTKTVQKEGG